MARYILNTLPEEKERKPSGSRKTPCILLPPKDTVEIKANIFTLQELAAELGIGTVTFFKLLRYKGILRSDNLPTKAYFRQGYLIVEKVPYKFSSGFIGYLPKARVTAKGMAFLKKLFKAEAAA
ncbi:MAG: phage antirepressor KilAC domain-containing protein [Treponema sp.]|jgi:phage antirepressor YoqD-like protein|nr:phage antirepressor KilAC domain-containing protein [Treponema sp.]